MVGDPASRSSVEDSEVAARLRMVIGRLGRCLRVTHAGGDLSPSQMDVLGTVVRRGPLGLSELAAFEGMNPSMLSRIAGRLESSGLITRMPDLHDGRAARLAATKSGEKVHQQVRAARTAALGIGLARLSEDERQSLTAALPALESLVEALRRDRC